MRYTFSGDGGSMRADNSTVFPYRRWTAAGPLSSDTQLWDVVVRRSTEGGGSMSGVSDEVYRLPQRHSLIAQPSPWQHCVLPPWEQGSGVGLTNSCGSAGFSSILITAGGGRCGCQRNTTSLIKHISFSIPLEEPTSFVLFE